MRLSARVSGPPPLTALADFDGTSFGPTYLVFNKGERIVRRAAPPDEDPAGWAFGGVLGSQCVGWYPPTYVKAI